MSDLFHMLRTIEVVPYDPEWPKLFQEEAFNLLAIFGPEVTAIRHIGSTSVPNLRAKPIIDILMVVRNSEKLDEFDLRVVAFGYLPKGEFGIGGRRFFIKGDEIHRTHHLHAFPLGHPEIERHLNFRDYLRSHPEEALKYGEMKEDLAQQFPNDIAGYMAGKEAFVKEIDRRAKAWRQQP